MEHRCGQRVSTNLPAVVRTIRGRAIRGTIRNMGCGGAFFVLPPDEVVPRGLVELELQLPDAEALVQRWKAFVVHRQSAGIGLMFNDFHLNDVLPFLAVQGVARAMGATGRSRTRPVQPAGGA